MRFKEYLKTIKSEPLEDKVWLKSEWVLFLILSIVLASLLFGTGLYSDDYNSIRGIENFDINKILFPEGNKITVPLAHYFFHIFYYISSYDFLLPVMLSKIFWAIISLYCITKYFCLWHTTEFSLMVSFMWICLPIHDATFYWLIGQYLIVSCALLFYAAYHLECGNKWLCVLFTILGSWVSYGSPAVVFSLFCLIFLQGRWRKGLYLLIPNLVYCAYYIVCTKYFSVYVSRLKPELGLSSLFKNLANEIISFIDASLGPSMLLKFYFTIMNVNTLSFIMVLFIIIALMYVVKLNLKKIRISPSILVLLFSLLIFNITMFTLTGAYPHVSFNLGNRVTAYSCFVVLYLALVFVSKYKIINYTFLTLLILSCYGNRNKFLKIESYQSQVVQNMGQNKDLKSYPRERPLFIKGAQYHKLGPFSDVEFLSENWVSSGIMRSHYGDFVETYALNRRWVYRNDSLVDLKYNVTISVPEDGISIYDADQNILLRILPNEISPYLASLNKEKRHWVQFIKNEYIQNLIKNKVKQLSYDL